MKRMIKSNRKKRKKRKMNVERGSENKERNDNKT